MQKELDQKRQKPEQPIFVFQSKINEHAINNGIDILCNGWVGLGKKTQEFEEAFADYCGAPYCVALNSATAALDIIYSYLRLNDELVLTTPLTFASTNTMLLKNKANVVFGNYDKDTLSISYKTLADDFATVREKIHPNDIDKAVIVNYGGLLMPKHDVAALLKSGVTVVNDLAHCAGAIYEDGTRAGSIGDYNVFSFHAVKNLASPDGGAIVTRNRQLYEYAKKYRWLGIDKDTISRTNLDESYSWKYDVEILGNKYHMNDLTAAILLGQLETLDEDNQYRRDIFTFYDQYINPVIGDIIPKQKTDAEHRITSAGHMAVLRLDEGINRADFITHLKEVWNVHPGVHYQHNSEFKIFSGCFNINTDEKFWERLVTLPCHLQMSDEDVQRVIEAVNSYEQG